MEIFSPATRRWFEANFDGPTDAQTEGWPVISSGRHSLITAPTGSGKTLAAFLWAIDRLISRHGEPRCGTATNSTGMSRREPGAQRPTAGMTRSGADRGVRVLYVSPLKALVYDIERNLRAPLAGIAHAAAGLGCAVNLPQVAIRTGDTPARERQRQLREPAEILVTTPESLYLLLSSRAAAGLSTIETIIVDEVHALAATKRGAHLALSLERLAALCMDAAGGDPQRIGLSATVRPLSEAARWLGGDRPVEIVDAAAPPNLDLRVSVPVPDMEHPPAERPLDPEGGPILGELYAREQQRPSQNRLAERGLWSAIYPALLNEILTHRSTIVFVNSRGLCERLSQRLNDLAAAPGADGDDDAPSGTWSDLGALAGGPGPGGPLQPALDEPRGGSVPGFSRPALDLVRAHHGSVSHQQRREIEDGLKQGTLKAIVATSSLEMGIDMGGVDQVLLVESPGSVARGLQRVGRAGHGVGQVSSGRIFPKYRGDLLECAVIAGRMLEGEIEPFRMPRNALDVLAQQLVAHCVSGPRSVDQLHALVRRAGPYRELTAGALESVLDMLSGHYPSSDFADLRPLLVWDRSSDTLTARKGAPMVTRLNAGTIPDRGNYAVHVGAEGARIGELDEEMVFETRVGECILLGASTWRIEEIGRDRVIVSPAPGEPGKLPFWRGDGPGRPVELGRALGEFCRQVAGLDPGEAAGWICRRSPLDEMAAGNLAAYIQDQREATEQVPSDRTIVVERFRDELGDWRICILTPFGARIHGPWAMALQWRLERQEGFEIQVMYTDDGIVLRLADGEALPELDALLPDPDEIEGRVTEQLADTALFASLFRENAGRALLLPRRSAKGRQPLWAQRLKAQSLLAVVRRYPAFPIVLETYRQALSDVFDLPGLKDVLTAIRSRAIRVHEVETRSASPFARSLVFAYVAAFIYEQDAPIAERRAQALTLDRGLLAELLGEAELRALIDPQVLTELERELQHLAPEATEPAEPSDEGVLDRRAGDPDQLHDLLRRLGDLDRAELIERCRPPVLPAPACEPPDGGRAGVEAWLEQLERQRRAARVRVSGQARWIAAEDAGLYRDALGCVPPPGLPERFVASTEAPLEQLLRRYARTHGPFTTGEPAARFGLRPAQVEPVLQLLEHQGALVRGEIRPAGGEPEWCDEEVLRRLRRRSLARARDRIAPVDGAALGRFLPLWHGIGGDHRRADRLLEVLIQLEGLSVTWSQLDRVLLPARVPDYRSEDLDLLAASGQIAWIGRAPAGPKDGRIAVYRRDRLAAIGRGTEKTCERESNAGVASRAETSSGVDSTGTIEQVLLDHLRRRGACFLFELQQALELAGIAGGAGDDKAAFETALWSLVWAGLVTNDTFAPLRGLTAPRRGGPPRRASGRARASAAPAVGGLAGGRWSLVVELTAHSHGADETERMLAWAQTLLERYGVVSRECVAAEDLPGGFGALYPVLKHMEEAGRVRRGHFIEGLSGAQFALPGAVERLRSLRLDEPPIDGFTASDVCILAAADPANPYGALLSWPAVESALRETTAGERSAAKAGPKRLAGAWLILVAGKPVIYIAANASQIMTFPDAITDDGGELIAALAALPRVPAAGRRRLLIRHIDGIPAMESPLREALLAAGFEADYDALAPARRGSGAPQGGGVGRGPTAVTDADPRR